MRKQQFFITVPLLPTSSLEIVNYEYDGFPERNVNNKTNNRSRFPGVPMLIHNFDPESEAEIVFVRTLNPSKPYAEENFRLLKEEIANIPSNENIDDELRDKFKNVEILATSKEIHLQYDESYSKQIHFFKDLCNAFMENADLYMDITYGSKVTPVASVSSLVYAENAKCMSVKELIYGLFAQAGSPKIFDVKSMYRMAQSLNLASYSSEMNLNKILDSFDAAE